MGESPSVGADFYVPEEKERREYRSTPGGTIVPKRIDDNGNTPAIDRANFFKNITINDYDGDQVRTLRPGEADSSGNPKPKDPPCPPSSPLSPTSTQGTPPGPPSTTPPNPLQPPLPTAASGPPGPGDSTTTTASLQGQLKRRGKQAASDPLMSLLQQVSQRLSSLESNQLSLTSSLAQISTTPGVTPPSKPVSAPSGSPRPKKLRLESAAGSMAFEALDVRTDTEGLLVLLLDPEKPRFLPSTGQEILVIVDETTPYHCQANDLAVKVGLGGHEVLVVLLVLLEPLSA